MLTNWETCERPLLGRGCQWVVLQLSSTSTQKSKPTSWLITNITLQTGVVLSKTVQNRPHGGSKLLGGYGIDVANWVLAAAGLRSGGESLRGEGGSDVERGLYGCTGLPRGEA